MMSREEIDSNRSVCSRCGKKKLDVFKICSDCYEQECFNVVRELHGSDALYYTTPVAVIKDDQANTTAG